MENELEIDRLNSDPRKKRNFIQMRANAHGRNGKFEDSIVDPTEDLGNEDFDDASLVGVARKLP